MAGNDRPVPQISRFHGIVVTMYYRDHAPPHFHAVSAEHEAQIVIVSGAVLHGWLPPNALRLVQLWCALHEAELMGNWRRARNRQSLDTIEPLR